MIVEQRGIEDASPAALELLPLALSRPKEALARARALLAERPGPGEASIAHQAAGIVLRDFGDVDWGIRELRKAVRLARAAGSGEREADALATLGNALVLAGRTRSGLAALDTAARQSTGVLAGRVRMRRGGMLMVLGRHREALEELRPALATLRRAGDTLWEARGLAHRAFVHLALGSIERADGDIGRSERLFAAAGQELELAFARHNRGLIAFRSGDLPAALVYLDEAAQRYEALGAATPDLSIDRCAVLLAAGLPREALQEADTAIGALDEIRGQASKRAELLLSAARSALEAREAAVAIERAHAAYRLFGAQHRAWWREHARLLLLQARYEAGAVTGRLPREAAETAARLQALGSTEAP
ncbi:MAG TPA: CHAT domain-containing protein, partial [Actinomycetes bacterium]